MPLFVTFHSGISLRLLRDQLRATGMDLVVFDASGSMVDPLLRFFRERERRLRR